MEFKKRKEQKLSPLQRCELKFKPGVTFNNGNIIGKEMNTLTIQSIKKFAGGTMEVTMHFSSTTNSPCHYTVYKNGKFADIIT